MPEQSAFSPTNRLLRSFDQEDRTALLSHLEPIELARGDVLYPIDEPIRFIVFPESGIVSMVASTDENHRIEIGIIGREGMTGGSHLLGVDRIPNEVFVQVPGEGLRISATGFLQVCAERPSIRQRLLRWMYVLSVQTGHTALANGGYNVEARLARWLLMCHDRLDGNEIELTHEFLSIMLAVRRSSVTITTHILEGSRAIKAERGLITIRDRPALEDIAGACYGVPEREYERILGPFC